eukprot:7405921-Pyramimonas_sp.AAC.1
MLGTRGSTRTWSARLDDWDTPATAANWFKFLAGGTDGDFVHGHLVDSCSLAAASSRPPSPSTTIAGMERPRPRMGQRPEFTAWERLGGFLVSINRQWAIESWLYSPDEARASWMQWCI